MQRANKPTGLSAASVSASTPQAHVTVDKQKVTAKLPSGESVDVLIHGATVTSWKGKDGTENIWLSDKAILDGSKPVRGGIPVVFPVFGPPPKSGHATSSLPQHGFARNVPWEYLGSSSSEDSEGAVKLDFGLYSSKLTANFQSAWPVDFGLLYTVTLSGEGLRTVLQVRNEGKQAFQFQFLLHTYLRVADISTTKVTGLTGVSYVDKVLDASEHVQSSDISILGEVDRVYKSIPQSTTSVLAAGKPRFDVVRDDKLTDVVIWNPWIEKAKGMGDFEPKDGYKHMLCVEVGAVEGWQTLDEGESWEGGQLIKSHL